MIFTLPCLYERRGLLQLGNSRNMYGHWVFGVFGIKPQDRLFVLSECRRLKTWLESYNFLKPRDVYERDETYMYKK